MATEAGMLNWVVAAVDARAAAVNRWLRATTLDAS